MVRQHEYRMTESVAFRRNDYLREATNMLIKKNNIYVESKNLARKRVDEDNIFANRIKKIVRYK